VTNRARTGAAQGESVVAFIGFASPSRPLRDPVEEQAVIHDGLERASDEVLNEDEEDAG